MNEAFLLNIGKEAVLVSFIVLAPILGAAMAVGLTISLFQAVTQIQDMTLTFVPKLVVVGVLLISIGGWMLLTLLDFTNRIFLNLALFTS
jgi:flagellar biosynthesis protein FliQ